MWSGVGSALIGAAGSIAGGLLSRGGESGGDNWAANYLAQKEFAQNGIRWRVDDAKAAGLHPLAALGSSGAMFSPTASYDGGSAGQDYSWLGDVGQNLGRAIDAGLTKDERMKQQAFRDREQELKLENMELQNQAIKNDLVSQIARDAIASNRAVIQQQQGPSMPSLRMKSDGTVIGQTINGQGDSVPYNGNLVDPQASQPVVNAPGYPAVEAGSHPELSYTRTSDGGYAPQMPEKLAEQLEENFLASQYWHLRNSYPPLLKSLSFGLLGNFNSAPPRSRLPEGAIGWRFDALKGAYYPVFHGYAGHQYRGKVNREVRR